MMELGQKGFRKSDKQIRRLPFSRTRKGEP